jgi:hypothetical protein
MNLNSNQATAIYQLYSQVAYINGDEAFDNDGNQVQYDIAAVDEQAAKNVCKAQATTLLQATDWTTIPDVANPAVSTPYLMNQAAFAAYRSQVRALAVNPVANPVFPAQPTEEWSQP